MSQYSSMYDSFPNLDVISLEDSFNELDSYKKLWFSVFFQTLKDLSVDDLTEDDAIKLEKWVNEEYTGSLSFICEVMGWDVDFLRRKLSHLLT